MGNVYKILGEKTINVIPDHYSSRMVVELCENIHLHYRNLRIEFSWNEFADFHRGMKNAFIELQKHIFTNIPISIINLADINPFDDGHRPLGERFDCREETEDHRNGIDSLKEFISRGGKTLPIAVYLKSAGEKYQRLDGFKRYWAQKELGRTEIECYVLPEYVAGIQEGM
jgi:hypothetical protein